MLLLISVPWLGSCLIRIVVIAGGHDLPLGRNLWKISPCFLELLIFVLLLEVAFQDLQGVCLLSFGQCRSHDGCLELEIVKVSFNLG
jgi:hypothetical protein